MTRGLTSLLRLALLCLALAGNPGCAVVNARVELTQPDRRLPSAWTRSCIRVVDFDDARRRPRVVGPIRNGIGMRTADFVTANDDEVRRWVGDYFRAQLSTEDRCLNPLILSGTVIDVSAAPEGLTTRLAVTVRLARGGDVLLRRTFLGRHEGHWFTLSALTYQDMLRSTLMDLGIAAVPTIIEAAEEAFDSETPPPL